MDPLRIIELILTPIVGFCSWIAGTRSRRNSVYQELLGTIKILTEQNKELQEKVILLQDEVIEVRKENAELKAGQMDMTRQMDELKAENKELKVLVIKNKQSYGNEKEIRKEAHHGQASERLDR